MTTALRCPDLDDSSWRTDIQNNLSILTENLSNIECLLIKLLENNLISFNESETIEKQTTLIKQNWKLLQTLKTKGWHGIKSNFLKILRQTNNDYCANIIESSSSVHSRGSSLLQHMRKFHMPDEDNVLTKLIKSKWWPEKKILPNSFYERKTEKELFTNRLKSILTQQENKNKTTVINQKVAVSGLGGVGKSTTAKWFGHQYKNDYELILWIDCGEGSLIKSFTNLARELNVKDRKELELKDLARGCFEILEKRNCLLIYDNAECYVGVDGIRDVLPNNNDNFHIIITSRNREWGNDTGYGTIPEFQLDVFEKSEALDFMSKNVNPLVSKEESELETICELLGNLPLALQIAVAAVNRSRISLQRYIEILKNTEEILVTTFDDYERTINKTMQISLDVIRNSENDVGGLAYQILLNFGFISPDDVTLDFFRSINKERTSPDIYRAAKLLESYSLVTHHIIRKKNEPKAIEYRFSIHRLLQQVIRHISAESKTRILRRILNCKGFLKHKLIPYSYADKKLQHEFPEIEAKFIGKLQLKKLLDERKFKEAMELSRIIKDSLKDDTSHYNYAMCLKYNTEIELATENFKNLFQLLKHRTSDGINQTYVFSKFEILEGSHNIRLDLVGGQLFRLYYRQKLEEEANQLFTTLRTIIFPHSDINDISSTLNWIWNMKPKSSYQFHYHGSGKRWEISQESEDPVKKIILSNCVLNENFQLKQLPKNLEELGLNRVELLAEGDKCTAQKLYLTETHFVKSIQLATVVEMTITGSRVNINILPVFLQKLKLDECALVVDSLSPSTPNQLPMPFLQELTLHRIQTVGDSYEHGIKTINISRLLSPKLILIEVSHSWDRIRMPKFSNIPLIGLQLIKYLSLESCQLVHTDGIRIAPQSLKLVHVQIIDNNENDLSHRYINYFIDLKNIQSLYLKDMLINLCYPVSISTVKLRRTKIVNWKKSNCHINHMDLRGIDVVEQTEMVIKEMTICRSIVHLSLLPQSLVILHLSNCTLAASCLFSADENQFPCLHKLILFEVKVELPVSNTKKVSAAAAPLRLPRHLNEFIIDCSGCTSFTINLHDLLHISKIDLQKCNLIYSPAIVLRPIELTLKNVNIIEQSTKNIVSINVNDFVCFSQTNVLRIQGMSIDFAEYVKVSSVFLSDTELINWDNGKWCIDNLRIWPAPGPTHMTIKHQEIKKETDFIYRFQ